MSILEELENDKKLLEELENKEKENQEDGTSTEIPQEEDEGIESGEQEDADTGDGEQAEEGGGDQEDGEENDKESPQGFRKLRREKAEEERRRKEEQAKREELEKRLAALEGERNAPTQGNEEVTPDINKDPVAWLEWNNNRLEKKIASLEAPIQEQEKQKQQRDIYESAVREFQDFEASFKSEADDYDDVAGFVEQRLRDSIKTVNPFISDVQLKQEVYQRVLLLGAQFAQQGLNPAEEIYYLAKEEWGYQPAQQEKEKPKRDMSKIAQNRKRNAGTVGAKSGAGHADVTLSVAADMPIHEFSKLTPAEKERLMRGG